MPEFERLDYDREVYAFFNEVVRVAFDELEEEHLAPPKIAKLNVYPEQGGAQIYVTRDRASDKKGFRYSLDADESKLLRSVSFLGQESETETLNENYQDVTADDIVDDFLLEYRGHPRGPIGEPPAD